MNKKVNDYWPHRPDKRAMSGTVEYRNGQPSDCPDCLGTGWSVKSHVLHLGHTAKQFGPCICDKGQFKGVRK